MAEIKKLSPEELAALREQIRGGSKPVEDSKAVAAAESFERAQEGGKSIIVNMAEDRMSATITLSDPAEGRYIVPELMAALRTKKIIVGIKTQVLIDMVSSERYNVPVVVAEGKELIPAVEGYYDYFFDTEDRKKPEIREDGTADYSAVGRLSSIQTGEKIAQYHPAVPGENGFDILGNEKIAKIPREKPVLRGQHIRYEEATREYFATKSGKISLADSNVEILDVHEIRGDVSIIQGTVEFFGDLFIHGNVENGAIIRAGRNVVIDGTVGGATINAGGDIILKKGITGGGKGKVSARGNVYSDFIEHTKVEAGADVHANSIMNSEISTYGNVVLSGKHGSIIGGDTHGLRGIVANTVGNENEVKTVLHAGFLREDYDVFLGLIKTEKKLGGEMETLLEKITEIFKISAKTKTITGNQKRELLSLNDKKQEIQKKLEDIKSDKADISRKMSMGMGASITIRGDVYRNVVICIDTAMQYIMRNESYVKYICVNETIERKAI